MEPTYPKTRLVELTYGSTVATVRHNREQSLAIKTNGKCLTRKERVTSRILATQRVWIPIFCQVMQMNQTKQKGLILVSPGHHTGIPMKCSAALKSEV